jgi:hypothetical protein
MLPKKKNVQRQPTTLQPKKHVVTIDWRVVCWEEGGGPTVRGHHARTPPKAQLGAQPKNQASSQTGSAPAPQWTTAGW